MDLLLFGYLYLYLHLYSDPIYLLSEPFWVDPFFGSACRGPRNQPDFYSRSDSASQSWTPAAKASAKSWGPARESRGVRICPWESPGLPLKGAFKGNVDVGPCKKHIRLSWNYGMGPCLQRDLNYGS